MKKEKKADFDPIRERLSHKHLIQIYGNSQVIFESCRRILEYSETVILLQGQQRVRITGKSLRLKELGGGNLSAIGRIESVVFESASLQE